MYFLRGIPITRGFSQGDVLIRYDITKKIINNRILEKDVKEEIARYHNALNEVKSEIKNLQKNKSLLKQNAQLVDYFLMLLNDDFFTKIIIDKINEELISADLALVNSLEQLKKEFDKLNNEYFQSRFLDFKSLGDRIIRKLHGDINLNDINKEVIIIAEDISPAEVLHIPRQYVLGIATETGSTTSHAAIIVESLGIPAVFGVKDLLNFIRPEHKVIIDGYKGIVIIDPTKNIINDYQHLKLSYEKKELEINNVLSYPTKTLDNVDIKIYGNVSNTMELNIARRHSAEGIGLLRTEMLFISYEHYLNENEQFEIYKEYLLLFKDKEVVIRLLDMGGDKFINSNENKDPNPFLGWRSIRVLLKETEKFKQQLRAIIRASVFNDNLKIMIPMISSIEEVRKVKEIYKECEEEVKKDGRPFKYKIPIGIMVEIPSTAIMAEHFIEEVDFFSIGTNDLVQYTLAVDRNNRNVSEYYQPLNPAVLYLIENTVKCADKHNKPVSICGEIARNPLYVKLLLGIGVKKFSINPTYIPLIKTIILKTSLKDAQELWNKVKKLKTATEIENLLKEDLKKNLPDIYETYFEINN